MIFSQSLESLIKLKVGNYLSEILTDCEERIIENISNIADNIDCIALSGQTLCLWLVKASSGESSVAVLLRYINLLLLDVFIGRMILHQARTISLPLIKGKLTENAS